MNPDFLRVKKNPLNTSTSKQLYSFTKSNRFLQRTPDQRYKFYDLKIPNTTSTSFGYGNKTDFQKLTEKSPGPAYYNLNQVSHRFPRLTSTFGAGRPQGKFDENPGPIYDVKNTLNGPKYSISAKNYYQLQHKNSSPGPGTYNLSSEKKQEKIGLIILFSRKSPSIGFPRQEKTSQEKIEKSPSPPYYYIQQKWGQGGYSIGSKLDGVQRSRTPGPGDYRIPGDFGFY